MVCVTVLASGSKGNCTVVATNRTRIMLDAGLSCREIVKRMRLRGEEPEKLDAVLITHEHQDHVQGLSVLARRWNLPVYATQGTHAAWKRWITPRTTMSFNAWLELRRQQQAEASAAEEKAAAEKSSGSGDGPGDPETTAAMPGEIPTLAAEEASPFVLAGEPETGADPGRDDPAYLPHVEYFRAGVSFEIGDISITPFTIPHDAADPVGFVLEAEGLRIAVATDLGYMPPNVRLHLRRADLLMLESNHDVEMLRDGPYPWSVKQRVLSRVGHLSNDSASEFLAEDYDGGARYVILAHLSEKNNLPELARIAAERALRDRPGLLTNRVLLASQTTPLESISL